MEELQKVEYELHTLIELDKKNWTHFYILLKKVEDQELWKNKYRSFTQWVKEFCLVNKTHESIIWNRKKAGKVYESYIKEQAKKGITVAPIEQAKVSADSLVLLDKINKYSPEAAAKLTDKVINKDITKKDLREVYKSIRPNIISNNPHLKAAALNDSIDSKAQKALEEIQEKVNAAKIVSTLCTSDWLGEKKIRKYFSSAYEQDKYRVFTEFPIFTGTSRKSRRMDMLIAENITTEEIWEINLHCIEIKISKTDLKNDKKFTEYAPFVDYVWLAITPELVEVAQEIKFSSCGIIVIENNKATILEKAIKLDGDKKQDTLTNLTLKLI